MAMDLIDRDEREPGGGSSDASSTKSQRQSLSSSASKRGQDPPPPLDDALRPPDDVLDLFDDFGRGADIDDSLLSLDAVDDERPGIDDCDLDASFDALDVAGVDLARESHESLTLAAVPQRLSRSPLSNCPDEDDLFYSVRTGLTPSGPMQKTPSGMGGGLLSSTDMACASAGCQAIAADSPVSSSPLPTQADDLTIDLPVAELLDAA